MSAARGQGVVGKRRGGRRGVYVRGGIAKPGLSLQRQIAYAAN